MHTYTHIHTHSDTHPHTHTRTDTHMHTCTHSDTHTHKLKYADTHTHTHTHIHTHIHTRARTRTHTHLNHTGKQSCPVLTFWEGAMNLCSQAVFLNTGQLCCADFITTKHTLSHTHTHTHTHTPVPGGGKGAICAKPSNVCSSVCGEFLRCVCERKRVCVRVC